MIFALVCICIIHNYIRCSKRGYYGTVGYYGTLCQKILSVIIWLTNLAYLETFAVASLLVQGDREDDECFCGVCKVKNGTELESKVWGLSVVIVKLGIIPLVWRWKILCVLPECT